MRNKLQIIGDKVYYNMECVATLNEFCISTAMENFKRELIKAFNERNEHESE